MKIKYEFLEGKPVEVEVSEEIGTVIVDSRREEENLARKERYHCWSLDGIDYEGEEYGKWDYYECMDESIDENARIREAFSKLTPTQQRRMWMVAQGMSIREIARREEADFKSVRESIEAARKKFKKFY